MCTAVAYNSNSLYFGRTLDNDFSYNEEITITPRNFVFRFRNRAEIKNHFAIIGMAYVCENYPLYFDAMNEAGLCMAGLNFVGNAEYSERIHGKENIAQFELIPWILSQCKNITEAINLLEQTNITRDVFSSDLPVAELHWIIADKKRAITVESVEEGLKIYNNPVGVLTNNPPFDFQLFSLNNYINLSPQEPENKFSDKINLKKYSRGMGAIGLPGDLSSQSRFIRAAFTNANSVKGKNMTENISHFFHIINTVEQPMGSCILDNGEYEKTIYTSCCCAEEGIYCYTTYGNRQINAVKLNNENLESNKLINYPLILDEQIKYQN